MYNLANNNTSIFLYSLEVEFISTLLAKKMKHLLIAILHEWMWQRPTPGLVVISDKEC